MTAAKAAAPSPVLPTDNYVTINNISKTFDGFRAVHDVSFSIRKGEIFALLGASGCGKSTLLRMLAGFEAPTAGTILLDGLDLNGLPPYRRPINMMFQSYALFPHMTVEQNIAYGLKQDKLPKHEINDRVQEMLKLVRMETYAKRKPHQLSGGQQQRVALARSLSKGPKLLLLDEPMGALDKKLRTQMQLEVVRIIERLGVTCVMVTHDQEEAMTMAHRIAIMEAGQISQIGTPAEIYEQPNCRYTASFIGSVNLFEGTLDEDQIDHCTIKTADLDVPIYVGHGVTGMTGMPCAFAVRPEKVSMSKTRPEQMHNHVAGIIQDIAYLGSESVYHVRLQSGKMVQVELVNAVRWGSERFAADDAVWIYWEDESGVVLTA
ncbi:MAG: potG [Verrucomicrobiaceae bacterium]|nr:potG [Verrucomicrobiaceae bacterium]